MGVATWAADGVMSDDIAAAIAARGNSTDPDDDLVLELAIAASAKFVITHNISDFRGSESMGVRAITPATTLNMIGP